MAMKLDLGTAYPGDLPDALEQIAKALAEINA
jgi:hypothetical protein